MQNKYGAIQAFRYIAAVAVVLFHTAGAFNAAYSVASANIFNWGARGVDLFFLISGFVIGTSHFKKPQSAKVFIVNRFARIAPSYWLLSVIAIFVGLFSSIGGTPDGGPSKLVIWQISSIFFSSHLAGFASPVLYQGWSLEYEMYFYVLFALGIALRFSKMGLSAFIITAVTFSTFAPGFTVKALGFVLGVLLAVLLNGYSWPKPPVPKWLLIAILASASGICAGASLVDFAWIAGCGSLVTALTLIPLTSSGLVDRLGSASYPLYLLQWFTVPAVVRAISTFIPTQVPWLFWITCCASVMLASGAGLVWDLLVDKPLTRWVKRRMLARLRLA